MKNGSRSSPGSIVTFVLLGAPLAECSKFDPDVDWREFVTGERAWILQTYLRLRSQGLPVALSDRLPANGIAVFSSKQRRRLRGFHTAAVLVGIREDVGRAHIADFEVVQNYAQVDGQRRFLIPFWPQPGLLPRDPARGARIEVIAFKGFLGNLTREYHGEEWLRFLREEKLEFKIDGVDYAGTATRSDSLAWNDYRNVDLVLAVRPPRADFYPRKPASKLYNAWHAGVPALLGPELAYRQLRQDPFDYIEVADQGEAMQAIRGLKRDPERYLRMIEHGRVRSAEYTVASITSLWSELLFDVIPRLGASPRVVRWRNRPLRAKETLRRLTGT